MVLLDKEFLPKAILRPPVVLDCNANVPIATLSHDVVLDLRAKKPIPTLRYPELLTQSDL